MKTAPRPTMIGGGGIRVKSIHRFPSTATMSAVRNALETESASTAGSGDAWKEMRKMENPELREELRKTSELGMLLQEAKDGLLAENLSMRERLDFYQEIGR